MWIAHCLFFKTTTINNLKGETVVTNEKNINAVDLLVLNEASGDSQFFLNSAAARQKWRQYL
jgi:hypothetical protein